MRPVMLATDGSPTAASATSTAIELARLLDADLVIVTVWDITHTTVGLAPMPVNGEFATETDAAVDETREHVPA